MDENCKSVKEKTCKLCEDTLKHICHNCIVRVKFLIVEKQNFDALLDFYLFLGLDDAAGLVGSCTFTSKLMQLIGFNHNVYPHTYRTISVGKK